jgi:hypothetical protein
LSGSLILNLSREGTARRPSIHLSPYRFALPTRIFSPTLRIEALPDAAAGPHA